MNETIFNFDFMNKNAKFVHKIDDFAQNICQKLPFSNILIFSTDEDFFKFGSKIYNELLKKQLKVQVVVLGDNFTHQLDDFFKVKEVLQEFRGVVIFDKNILCHMLNYGVKLPKIFYLQCSSDIYGIFDINKSEILIEYYFLITDFDRTTFIKIFSVRTLALIDYIFLNALTKNEIDLSYFSKIKSLLVCGVTSLSCEQELQTLFSILIMVEKSFAKKQETKFFSANVSCYLMQKQYYDLKTNFLSSKKIIKNYIATFSNKYKNELCFSDRAKLVSFFSKENLNYCLSSLVKQTKQISANLSASDKQEIKSLLKVYNKFVSEIENKEIDCKNQKDKSCLLKNHKLDTCVSICGDTALSINGMTWVRQMSLVW